MNQRLKQEITRSYPVLRRSEKKTADYEGFNAGKDR